QINVILLIFLFFFFQAEDGIRDFHVTGVQTCALPIWSESHRDDEVQRQAAVDAGTEAHPRPDGAGAASLRSVHPGRPWLRASGRSEERRVGKECRAWRRTDLVKKKCGRAGE